METPKYFCSTGHFKAKHRVFVDVQLRSLVTFGKKVCDYACFETQIEAMVWFFSKNPNYL